MNHFSNKDDHFRVHLSYKNYQETFEGEISKEEYFKLHNKPWPQTLSGRLSLEQGKFVMEQRLKELDLSQSGDTPGDGNCMMHCLMDQLGYSEGLRDFAESAQDLRWKICNYGYDFYLRTGRLTWSFDPENNEFGLFPLTIIMCAIVEFF